MDPIQNGIIIQNETELISNTVPLLQTEMNNLNYSKDLEKAKNNEYDPYLIPPSKTKIK